MNEGAKTGIFVAIAAVALIIGTYMGMPRGSTESDTRGLVGKPMFESFTDALDVRSMRIVEFNEELGELSSFEVAQNPKSGVWTIPTRGGYPADATEQMRDAATALLDLKVLDVASETRQDHALFGVVEPDKDQLAVGDEGVGTLVTVENKEGDDVVDIIIGKEVRDDETKRFVRRPSQDIVYVVELSDSVFTTDFKDWIEEDLLQLSPVDIRKVRVKDYSVVRTLQGGSLENKFDATLTVDDGNNWNVAEMYTYPDPRTREPISLAEGETLHTENLAELKNALDDLKIVDVYRKPEGLSADLKADEDFVENAEAVNSLVSKGFYPQKNGDEVEVFASSGELIVTLESGVQYLLRFGDVESVASGQEEDEEEDGGLNRYLLVSARLDESAFPPLDLQTVPQSIEELEGGSNSEAAMPPKSVDAAENEKTAPADDADASNGQQADEKESVEEVPADELPDTSEAKQAETDSGETPEEETPAEDDGESADRPAADSEEPAEGSEGAGEASGEGNATVTGEGAQADETESEDAPAEQPSQENGAESTESAPESQEASSPPLAPADETEEERQERLEAEQERVIKANQRKQDERAAELEEAGQKVRELNARFADWYYVVPESTYRNLMLSKEQLIKAESAESEQDTAALPQTPFPLGPGN